MFKFIKYDGNLSAGRRFSIGYIEKLEATTKAIEKETRFEAKEYKLYVSTAINLSTTMPPTPIKSMPVALASIK